MIPSFQSTGTFPVLQTLGILNEKEWATGWIAHLSSSGEMPRGPAARPFLRLLIAAKTSAMGGLSVDTEVSTGDNAASLSSSSDGEPGRWFNAEMKCWRLRSSISSSETHGDPLNLWMKEPATCFLFPDSSRLKHQGFSPWHFSPTTLLGYLTHWGIYDGCHSKPLYENYATLMPASNKIGDSVDLLVAVHWSRGSRYPTDCC